MLAHRLTLLIQSFFNPSHTEIQCAGADLSLHLSTKKATSAPAPALAPLSLQQILQRSRSSASLATCCQVSQAVTTVTAVTSSGVREMAEPLPDAGFTKAWFTNEVASYSLAPEDANTGEVDANKAWEAERQRKGEKMEDGRKERERQHGATINFR